MHRVGGIAVVGGGITGLSVAWHLRRAGHEVAIVERAGLGSGATGMQPGGVRRQWGSRANCLLASESLAFYRELGDRLGVPVQASFDACGYLFLAHGDAGRAQLEANVALQNGLGITSRLVTPSEAEGLVAGLDVSSVVAGAYSAEDGYFDRPLAVVGAFADACRREGVRLVHGDVLELRPDGEGWALHLAGRDSLHAGGVVVAAAYESRALVAPLGVDLPVEREPRYLFYSEPIRERLLEPLVVSPERRLAAKQLADGSVLASDLSAGTDPPAGEPEWRARLRRGLDGLLPILRYVSFPVLVEGRYDQTPDGVAVVSSLPGRSGLWVAAGSSGHGFMTAPAVGRIVADLVAGACADPLLSAALSLERFAEAGRGGETQVV